MTLKCSKHRHTNQKKKEKRDKFTNILDQTNSALFEKLNGKTLNATLSLIHSETIIENTHAQPQCKWKGRVKVGEDREEMEEEGEEKQIVNGSIRCEGGCDGYYIRYTQET